MGVLWTIDCISTIQYVHKTAGILALMTAGLSHVYLIIADRQSRYLHESKAPLFTVARRR